MKEKTQKNKKLRDWIDSKCFTLRDFADLSGLQYNCVHALANGYRKPSRQTACIIVKATKGQLCLKDLGYE